MEIGPGTLLKRLPGGAEEQVIHSRGVMHEQAIECIRKGKHNMEIGNRKQVSLSVFNPGFTLGILALGAMTVTATVV
jgi:hypothetical protein